MAAKKRIAKKNRWASAGLCNDGIPLADSLAPVIEAWLDEVWTREIFPGELANIAKAVVSCVADEKKMYFNHNRWRSRNMGIRS